MSVVDGFDTGESGSNRNWSATVTRWVVALALAGLVVALGAQSDTPPPIVGLAGAVAILLARYALSTPYVVAVGQVAIVATLGSGDLGPMTIAAEAVLLVGVAVPGGWTRRGVERVLSAGVVLVVLGGVTLGATLSWDPVWAVALAALATGGLIGYGLHRYEQVSLGVVDSE